MVARSWSSRPDWHKSHIRTNCVQTRQVHQNCITYTDICSRVEWSLLKGGLRNGNALTWGNALATDTYSRDNHTAYKYTYPTHTVQVRIYVCTNVLYTLHAYLVCIYVYSMLCALLRYSNTKVCAECMYVCMYAACYRLCMCNIRMSLLLLYRCMYACMY